jgi:hypothetical protein
MNRTPLSKKRLKLNAVFNKAAKITVFKVEVNP